MAPHLPPPTTLILTKPQFSSTSRRRAPLSCGWNLNDDAIGWRHPARAGENMPALHDLSADALRNAYRTRQLSPVEVTRAVLERIEAWEPKIHAMYTVDAVGALAQA